MYLNTMRGHQNIMAIRKKLSQLWHSSSIMWTHGLCDETRFRKRPQGGGRILKDWKIVFTHNNWDNVVWDESQETAAQAKVSENSQITLTTEEIERLEAEAAGQWDKFYGVHQNRFFKDRNWLFTEFPELAPHLAHTFPLKQNPSNAQLLSVEIDPSEEEAKVNQPGCNVDNVGESSSKLCSNNSEVETKDGNTLLGGDTGTIIEQNNDIDAENRSNSNQENQVVHEKGDCESSKKNEGLTLEQKTNTDEASEESISESYPGEKSRFRVLEVGCGVGNTVFPILSVNNDERLFVYCCDFSSTAVGLVKDSPDYNQKRCHAFVCDVTSEDWGAPFPKSSLDIIVCIFVLSAVHPDKLQDVVNKMGEYLRPGGRILFRDYGRYDLAQLRFKKGRCLAQNFYARGDGTRCYFFTQEDVRELMTGAGLVEEQNLVDRRLQVNRGKQLTMYRVWVQAKYRKPSEETPEPNKLL